MKWHCKVANGNISTNDIVTELLDFIAQASVSEEDFNRLALKIFTHQFELNRPFQKYCQGRGKTPRMVKTWRDIPAVPINAFKDLTLSCVEPDQCERVFMTSGTTRHDVKGRHHHPTLAVYGASMLKNFSDHFMSQDKSIRMGILFPTEEMMPNSSLAHYLGLAIKHFGSSNSAYYIDQNGLQFDLLCSVLRQAQSSSEPIALLGATYSYVHLMDELDARALTFKLPQESRLLDTGGFKGQSREIPMSLFYEQLSQKLGVDPSQCINMYGMTELSTQFYDRGNQSVPSIKRGPHWIKSRLVDPLSGQDVTPGERGILVHTDLANFNSVVSILTEDVGVAMDDGFLLLGRAEGAQAKGCSMAVDEFLKTAQ